MTWQRETGTEQSQGQAPERGIEEEDTQKEESERWRGSERGKAFLFAASYCAQRKRKTVKMGQNRFCQTPFFLTNGLIAGFFVSQRKNGSITHRKRVILFVCARVPVLCTRTC